MEEVHVVSFSGGKDSTAMLLLMIEKKMRIDCIFFVDTTKEYPDLYNHLEKVKKYIYPLKIETIDVKFNYWFSEHIKTKGKNKGKKGYGWPTPMGRWCTALKREGVKKAVKNLTKTARVIEYHGIAADEAERAKKNQVGRYIKYPLIDFNVTEKDALEYCYSKGFNWNGLYEKVSRVSCYCCPLARLDNLRTIRREFPDLWQDMIEMDTKTDYPFKLNYSVLDLDRKFKKEESDSDFMQLSLLDDLIIEDVSGSCANKSTSCSECLNI